MKKWPYRNFWPEKKERSDWVRHDIQEFHGEVPECELMHHILTVPNNLQFLWSSMGKCIT